MSQYGFLFAIGTIFSFGTSIGIGANDVANCFATSVGAKSLKMWQAIVIACTLSLVGALSLGGGVAETVARGIVNPDLFDENPGILMVGMVCALLSTTIWLLVASKAGLPVSTTHSIVGSLVGFGMVAHGPGAVNWSTIVRIVVSWFLSPLISGVVSLGFWMVIRQLILRAPNSADRAIKSYPLLVGLTVFVNVLFVVLKVSDFPVLMTIAGAIVVGIISGITLWLTFVPYFLRPRVLTIMSTSTDVIVNDEGSQDARETSKGSPVSPSTTTTKETDIDAETLSRSITDRLIASTIDYNVHAAERDARTAAIHNSAECFSVGTEYAFTFLQIFTAAVSSLALGANDVANSVGPFAAILGIFNSGTLPVNLLIPEWALAFGGVGICLGMALFGHHVIQSIGVELIKVTPSRGVCIELSSSLVVVVGSVLGLPLSTTHCQVGAEIGVGLCERQGFASAINLWLLLWIATAWVATLFITAGMTSFTFALIVFSPSMPGF